MLPEQNGDWRGLWRDYGPKLMLFARQQAWQVSEAEDEGVVYASATQPLRQIRCQVVATSEWRNAKDHTKVEVWIPREEVMLVTMRVY